MIIETHILHPDHRLVCVLANGGVIVVESGGLLNVMISAGTFTNEISALEFARREARRIEVEARMQEDE